MARFTQMYINSHLKEGTKTYDDIGSFMPYPAVWEKYERTRKISVSRECAIEFLKSYKSFGAAVEMAFSDWMEDLISIANGD